MINYKSVRLKNKNNNKKWMDKKIIYKSCVDMKSIITHGRIRASIINNRRIRNQL